MFRDGVENAQRVLRAVAGYRGAIDGKPGPASLAAALRVQGGAPAQEPARRVVGAAQRALAAGGFDPGPPDGFWGPQTDAAFSAWRGDVMPDRRNESPVGRESDLKVKFGPPGGRECTAGRIVPPWRMVLAWDQSSVVSEIACHEIVAASANRAFERIAAAYSPVQIRDLGLHLFGGCFNERRKRGGAAWSTHAWGVAMDFDPERNRLQWGRDRARLAQRDAGPFWRAWESEGWLSLGRAKNFDWMHAQAVRL